jgi:hypothetical protein
MEFQSGFTAGHRLVTGLEWGMRVAHQPRGHPFMRASRQQWRKLPELTPNFTPYDVCLELWVREPNSLPSMLPFPSQLVRAPP